MWKKGESGNPKGTKSRRLITTHIERELLQAANDGDVTKARQIAEKVVQMAVDGNTWAIQFVTERTEGKPDQHVSITRNVKEISDGELADIATGSGEGASESPVCTEVASSVH